MQRTTEDTTGLSAKVSVSLVRSTTSPDSCISPCMVVEFHALHTKTQSMGILCPFFLREMSARWRNGARIFIPFLTPCEIINQSRRLTVKACLFPQVCHLSQTTDRLGGREYLSLSTYITMVSLVKYQVKGFVKVIFYYIAHCGCHIHLRGIRSIIMKSIDTEKSVPCIVAKKLV